jgi:hypothetical protein
VLDDGATVFDLAQSKYSISGERNKCLLHLWSAERNLVRRVLDVEIKHEVLRLALQGLGQTRPGKLEICRQRDRPGLLFRPYPQHPADVHHLGHVIGVVIG